MSEGREYTNPRCAERSGFLFPHECPQIAATTCDACGKAICFQHTESLPSGRKVCIACARQNTTSDSTGETGDGSHTTDNSSSTDRPGRDTSPYWYAGHHYQTYHWHRDHDFTDGDEAALGEVSDSDDADWEKELGAS